MSDELKKLQDELLKKLLETFRQTHNKEIPKDIDGEIFEGIGLEVWVCPFSILVV